MKLYLLFSTILIALVVFVIWYFYSIDHFVEVVDGNRTVAKINLGVKQLTVFNLNSDPIVRIDLDSSGIVGKSFPNTIQCDPTTNKCLKWGWTSTVLTVSAQQFSGTDNQTMMHCVKIGWKTNGARAPKSCILFSNLYKGFPNVWYSSRKYILLHNNFLQKFNTCSTFIPGSDSAIDPFGKVIKNYAGNVIEPLWFSSQGAAVKASNHHTLRVCQEESSSHPMLCMEPMVDRDHLNQFHNGSGFHLDYAVCVAESLPVLYENMMKTMIKPRQTAVNNRNAFSDLVNDGVYFEDKINQTTSSVIRPSLVSECKVLVEKPLWNVEYLRDVVDENLFYLYLGYPRRAGGTCHLKNFTMLYTHLGDFKIRDDPNHSHMNFLTAARKSGLHFMLPVTPFINFDSSNFAEGSVHNYLIKNAKSDAPLLIKFDMNHRQFPAIVDVTSSSTSTWFISLADELRSTTNVSLFHFYFGQSSWLPHSSYNLARSLHNIGHFSTSFADLALEFSRCAITDVAFDSQNFNQFVLLSPFRNMEETLAGVLAAGMAGYPFVVANFPCPLRDAVKFMDPGVLERGIIRWVELVSFFPVVHIPWDYKTLDGIDPSLPELVVNATMTLMAVRNSDEVAPKIRRAFEEAEVNGSRPVVAPMWMAPDALTLSGPGAEKLLLIEDQFMIGPDMFVAPVLDMTATSRSVFIPPGKWKDVVNHRDTQTRDGKWLRNYEVDLMKIPVFVRIDSVI